MTTTEAVDAGLLVPGALAVVRNRAGVISQVTRSGQTADGVLHLVTVSFADRDGSRAETVIWEREPGARVLPGAGLPHVLDSAPMSPAVFQSLVRANRWSALRPYVDPDADAGPLDRLPLASPLHGAIEPEDYQMVPLLKAMTMPRVQLLLADDVGLGKTVEAGLIITELILQRRIGRILILTPASLRSQWQKELKEKFALDFALVDRTRALAMKRELGLDANPWRANPLAIASYHYIKQPDVLDEFLSTCRVPEGSPHLPWDLLVVDEAHNLAPAAFGENSDLARMLRLISPHFEHRVFATATPHNGRTRCFSGLLEILDPARFSQTSEFTAAERARVREVVVRRLKSEINAVTDPPRFTERHPQAVPLALDRAEARLSAAFGTFRSAVFRAVAGAGAADRVAGCFALEVLGKRMLSCPHTFAHSWFRILAGIEAEEQTTAADVRATERVVREETDDDVEAESRVGVAVRVIGAWLRPFAPGLRAELESVTAALADLGLRSISETPRADTRYAALLRLINEHLRGPGAWLPDERLIVFTEFKATLDYLVGRLRRDFPEEGVILELFGSGEMDERERRAVTEAFNNPAHPVRILVATDAASEGLNLQATARYLLHFDVPWSPSRLEQRNGRVDRYGQSRDVTVFHYTSDDDADLDFLAYIVSKVHRIRQDLGSMAEVIDAAVQRRLIEDAPDADVRRDLDLELQHPARRPEIPHDASARASDIGGRELGRLMEALRDELDFDGNALLEVLRHAVAPADPGRIEREPRPGLWRLVPPVPPAWREVVDAELRLAALGGISGPLPALAFDAQAFIQQVDGRPVFRPPANAVLMHLWHPVVAHALLHFTRLRFPGMAGAASRWTAAFDPEIPSDVEALLLVIFEELGVNELRETFHHWVRTLAIPVRGGRCAEPLPHRPARAWRANGLPPPGEALIERARAVWATVEDDIAAIVERERTSLEERLARQLAADLTEAERREQERFASRQGELSQMITEARVDRLTRELDLLRQEQAQGSLFADDPYTARLRESAEAKQMELQRLRLHIEDLRAQLARERERVVTLLLPRRHTLLGRAQCLPLAVEVRFRP